MKNKKKTLALLLSAAMLLSPFQTELRKALPAQGAEPDMENLGVASVSDDEPDGEPDEEPDDTPDDEPDDEPTPKPSPAKAVTRFQDKKSNGEYKILTSTKSGGTVTLQKPLKDSAKAAIPATVKHDKKTYKVTNISSKAFYGKKKLKTVTIGKNVTTIGSKAFYSCTALKEIVLPAKVKKIGSYAFYNCRKTNELSIETKKLSSKNIGSDAFLGTGNINYKKLIIDVPISKFSAYTKVLLKKGISPKAVIMPAGGNAEAFMPEPAPLELTKDFLSLTVKKSDSETSYGKATVILKRMKGVQLKTITYNIKKQGIITTSIKGKRNPSIKVKARKQGSTKVILSVRYQLGRKTKTEKLTLGVEVTLKDTRKKTTKKPSTSTPKKPTSSITATPLPIPSATATPEPTPSATATPEPTATNTEHPAPTPDVPTPTSSHEPAKPTKAPQDSVQKNASDVAALNKIIAEQGKPAGMENLNSDCYTWDDQGFLTEISWGEYNLSGKISFSQLKHLKKITCAYGNISVLDVSGNAALTYLSCGGNQLTSLDVSRNTSLTHLDCDENQLTSLDVSRNTSLTYLYCGGNQLTSLDVSKNTSLTYLDCWENQLTSLDVSRNTSLTELSCRGNQLTSLDVSKNTVLTYLSCGGNQLTSLDVSKNTSLTELYCGGNQLTSLNVSRNTALTDLSCGGNQLTSLDVSRNTSLKYLECWENQLTSLDVSKNTSLTELYCGDNQLTSLDVSKNTSLTYLNCDDTVTVTGYKKNQPK